MTQIKSYPKWGLFRKGIHISQNGQTFVADDAKINSIVSATQKFPYQNNEIPVVVGHPKSDSPKWGSFLKDKIERLGDEILGLPNYLVPEFEESLKKKMYDTVSIALRGDDSIRHIALLGGAPPAVTGLSPVYFGEADLVIAFAEFNELELSKWWFQGLTQLLRGIKNYLIEEKGQEKADLILPESQMIDLDNPPAIFGNMGTAMNNSFTENKNKDINMTQEQIDALKTENELLKANELKAVNEKKQLAYVAFCESDDMKKKITPKIKPVVLSMMAKVEESGEICFSEADGVEKKVSAIDEFKNLLKMLPDAVEFNEIATRHNAEETKTGVTAEVKTGHDIADQVNKKGK